MVFDGAGGGFHCDVICNVVVVVVVFVVVAVYGLDGAGRGSIVTSSVMLLLFWLFWLLLVLLYTMSDVTGSGIGQFSDGLGSRLRLPSPKRHRRDVLH